LNVDSAACSLSISTAKSMEYSQWLYPSSSADPHRISKLVICRSVIFVLGFFSWFFLMKIELTPFYTVQWLCINALFFASVNVCIVCDLFVSYLQSLSIFCVLMSQLSFTSRSDNSVDSNSISDHSLFCWRRMMSLSWGTAAEWLVIGSTNHCCSHCTLPSYGPSAAR